MITRIATFFKPFQYLFGVEKGVFHSYIQIQITNLNYMLEIPLYITQIDYGGALLVG